MTRFLMVAMAAAVLTSCGSGEPTGGCTVDCSNMFTGRIDVRNFGYLTREACVAKGVEATCTAKWCDYACESPCCVTVH